MFNCMRVCVSPGLDLEVRVCLSLCVGACVSLTLLRVCVCVHARVRALFHYCEKFCKEPLLHTELGSLA